MIDVIARSQRLLGKEVYFPWGVDRNGINIEFTVEKNTGRKMKTYGRQEFLDLCEETIEEYTQAMRNTAKRVGLSVILIVNIRLMLQIIEQLLNQYSLNYSKKGIS